MKRLILPIMVCAMALPGVAKEIKVADFDYAGPYPVNLPLQIDSVDVNSHKFDYKSLLKTHLTLNPSTTNRVKVEGTAPGTGNALHTLAFSLENTRFTKAKLNISGLKDFEVYLDGKKLNGTDLTLTPATHRVVIKYLTREGVSSPLDVIIDAPDNAAIALREDGKRMFTLADALHGTRISGVSLSPDGRYLLTNYTHTAVGGRNSMRTTLTDLQTGRVVNHNVQSARWMPKSNKYYYTRPGLEKREIVTVDPATGAEEVFAENIPDGFFRISPTEDYLVYTVRTQGPKEDPQVYEIIQPEDRQAGWRDRSGVARYDLATGLMQPLTFGYNNVRAADISDDGKQMLLMTSRSRLEKRPTTVTSIILLDLATMKPTTLVSEGEFLHSAQFSPDGKSVLVTGTPEAFGNIGNVTPAAKTASMSQTEMFMLNVADKSVRPITKTFDPNVKNIQWSRADGQIYFTAENGDEYSLYKLSPTSGKIEQIPTSEDVVNGFAIARTAPALAWYGQSVTNPDVLYALNTKTGKQTVLDRPSDNRMSDVQLGKCEAWNFVNSRGDTIQGRYYLPPNFDPNKKYPMIVNYYGGCSPTSRNFESRYPHHAYAALGYVVYVVEPSGATGYGQEFASRHVNTAGDGPAQDIIEGTKQFLAEHPYVDASKIGCIGASYGGFMTQYLQTVSDLFAAAISHAGISDHTSYWGEGYWGYSYSEVSMANSYPWTHPDLYVKQSPLYNADKIHTPILFLHGDKDMNVPLGESIQMFTALKLLGRETAFVAVKDQEHHILDYDKRNKWQNTIFAWFAKYLQDDPSWWEQLYPQKAL